VTQIVDVEEVFKLARAKAWKCVFAEYFLERKSFYAEYVGEIRKKF
jgi:hypothetical protein